MTHCVNHFRLDDASHGVTCNWTDLSLFCESVTIACADSSFSSDLSADAGGFGPRIIATTAIPTNATVMIASAVRALLVRGIVFWIDRKI